MIRKLFWFFFHRFNDPTTDDSFFVWLTANAGNFLRTGAIRDEDWKVNFSPELGFSKNKKKFATDVKIQQKT